MTCINPLNLLWKFHPNQTSESLSRLYLYSKSLPGVLEDMEVMDEPVDGVIWHISSKYNNRKPVMTLPVLQVTSWSLGGHEDSWWTYRWCYMTCINHLKLLWKFHPNPTSGSLSRLSLSSKSLPGFMKDMEVLKNLEMVSYDIYKPSEVALKISSKSNIRNPTCPPSPFLESLRTWRFLINLEMVSDQWEHPYDLSVQKRSSEYFVNIYLTFRKKSFISNHI